MGGQLRGLMGFVLLGSFAWAGDYPTLQSVEDLTTQLRKNAGREISLEETLVAIGDAYPELRENYILLHDSKSRQEASYEYPRVISFSPNATFTIAFNGNPQAKGFYELEMFEFSAAPTEKNAKAESFKFRRLRFRPSADYIHAAEEAAEASYPTYKPINESLCTNCHGKSSLRPNWEAYNLWEGAYFRTDVHHVGDKYALPWKSEDHAGFDSFYTKQANKGRYSFLKGLEARYVVPIKDYSRASTSQYTQVVGYLNYRRVAHLIREAPGYEKYKYATIGALYDCKNFEALLPKDFAPARPLEWYIKDTQAGFKKDANYFHLEHEHSMMGKLRFLYEGRGLSMRKWSMSRRRSPYSFVTPGGSPEGFISDALIEIDPTLEKYRVWRTSKDDRHYSVGSGFVKQWTGSMHDMVGPACKELEAASQIR